ncbi:peptidoglycan DD-metalloendopeptidase family protein [Ructibacterium gallinarum]|uniref:M23 family metallopeptidase n=1 Tax=Ructibacterium gallinarum TaxID=2779355 RepID=A0A9D5M504_9FIRM|nr:M23 family metallopeptidase [Ructibacterium gallinarum]MBE5039557.1 M23 family metallopeptidase [Ructibacterium gallinarum]
MRENRKKESIFAKRGFFITLIVITAVMVIAVVMNLIMPDDTEKDTFDPNAWQSAVEQSAKTSENTKAVSSTAIPSEEKANSSQNASNQTPGSVPGGTNTPAAQTWGEDKEEPAPSSSVAPSSTNTANGKILLEKPVSGAIIKDYSADELVYSETMQDWRVHEGIDFAAEEGTDVKAAADGTVQSIDENGMLGTCVILKHSDGTQTLYGNLQENSGPPIGTEVKTGDTIGKAGKTAALEIMDPAHIHFEVIVSEKSVNPHDYFGESSNTETE